MQVVEGHEFARSRLRDQRRRQRRRGVGVALTGGDGVQQVHFVHLFRARVEELHGVHGSIVPAAEDDGEQVDGGDAVIVSALREAGEVAQGRPLAAGVIEKVNSGAPSA